MKKGYLVSDVDPDQLKLRFDALKAARCDHIFVETKSGLEGKSVLHDLLSRLKEGDTLVVWSLASVADSMPELVKLILQLNDRAVRFVALAERFDTDEHNQVLKAILQQLNRFESSVVSTQRDERCTNTRPGRPPALTPQSAREAWRLVQDGLPIEHVARRFGVSKVTLHRYFGRLTASG